MSHTIPNSQFQIHNLGFALETSEISKHFGAVRAVGPTLDLHSEDGDDEQSWGRTDRANLRW